MINQDLTAQGRKYIYQVFSNFVIGCMELGGSYSVSYNHSIRSFSLCNLSPKALAEQVTNENLSRDFDAILS